jgi:hypothetical protein
MAKHKKITVLNNEITVQISNDHYFVSLTDMLKGKDGEFFISDWLRNRNTIVFLGIWESVNNPSFNYGEFAIIKSQAVLSHLPKHVRTADVFQLDILSSLITFPYIPNSFC